MRFTATPTTATSTSPSTASTPTTEKVVTVNNGFDLEIAHRAIARIEQRQGWEREARGLYAVDPDGRAERLRPRDQGERSRPVGPRTWRSEPANAAPSGSQSRRPRRSFGRREAGASCTPPSPPRGCATRRRVPARCSGSASSRSRRAPSAATARWRRLRKRLGEFEPAPSTPVAGPGSIARHRPIGAHAARLPRRTPQALPGPRGQTSASNR